MASSKPNLLFIFSDEQRPDTIGVPHIRTPHLDQLASESVVFERAYCTSPLCTPSRSTLMTGFYPHTTGCLGNNKPLLPHIPTIGERLKDCGYHRGYFGKWHLGDEILCPRGFDEYRSIEDASYRKYLSREEDKSKHSTYYDWLVQKGQTPDGEQKDGYRYFSRKAACRMPLELTKPMYLAGEVDRFLRENQKNPFIAYVSILEPHMPFTGPYDSMYAPGSVPLPKNFDQLSNEALPFAKHRREMLKREGFEGQQLADEKGWRQLIARYHGLVTQVDESVGRMLASLRQYGLDENTIVVFTSDHGDMMGSHGLLAKNILYEEAVRIPLLMKVPGTAPRRVGESVSQIDLVPTILDYVDQPAKDLPGHSLRSVCESGKGVRSPIVCELARSVFDGGGVSKDVDPDSVIPGGRSIQSDDGWKLNLYDREDPELFDLNADPLEMRNRAKDPECTERVASLVGLYQCFRKQTRDPFESFLKNQ
jgi:arylsulfatase A-like enzyme